MRDEQAKGRRWVLRGRRRVEAEVDDELAFHLAMRERDFARAGLSPEAPARR
jgi:hypothetical protein